MCSDIPERGKPEAHFFLSFLRVTHDTKVKFNYITFKALHFIVEKFYLRSGALVCNDYSLTTHSLRKKPSEDHSEIATGCAHEDFNVYHYSFLRKLAMINS